jgi:putative SOS response-associated peptidase YedK
MCGRFDQNKTRQQQHQDLDRFLANAPFAQQWNIAVGAKAYVLLQGAQGYESRPAQFGLSPAWAPKKMYLLNARSEGKQNPDNRADYTGALDIFTMPAFRKAMQHRCVLYITGFYEGPEKEKLKKPFRLSSLAHPYLFLAGITEAYIDPSTGEVTDTFSIITQAAVPPVAAIGHHRSPVFLQPDTVEQWLRPATPRAALEALLQSRWYPPDLTATPVDSLRIRLINAPEPLR